MSILHVTARIAKSQFTLDVDFTSDAHVTLLQGPSGAGKTLTLHLIAGLIPTDTARITLGVQDLTDLPSERRDIAMSFQEPRLFPHLTVRRNILYSGGARGQLDVLAKTLDITDLLERRPADLSGGQAQRVSLARALLPGAALVLLDEPFTGLDPTRREAVARAIAAQPGHVVMVSHDATDAARFGARTVRIADGIAR